LMSTASAQQASAQDVRKSKTKKSSEVGNILM